MPKLIITSNVPDTLALDCATLAARGREAYGYAFAALGNLIANISHQSPNRPVVALHGEKAPGAERWNEWSVNTMPQVVRLSLPEDDRRSYRYFAARILRDAQAAADMVLARSARMVHDWLGWDIDLSETDAYGRNEIRSAL